MVNLQVFLKQGPYGHYVQVGEDKKGLFPKRASLSEVTITTFFFLFLNENSLPAIPEHFQELKTTTVELLFQVKDTDTVTLEDAIELLQYPKILVCIYLSCSCWCYLFKLGPMMFYFPAGKTS